MYSNTSKSKFQNLKKKKDRCEIFDKEQRFYVRIWYTSIRVQSAQYIQYHIELYEDYTRQIVCNTSPQKQ